MVELDVAGAGLARTAKGADQAGRAGAALHDVALEVVLGQVGDRAKDQILEDPLVARPVEGGGELGNGRRPPQDEPVHDLAAALEEGVIVRVGSASFFEKRGDLRDELVHLLPGDEPVLVALQRREGARIARDQFDSVPPDVELVQDLLRRQRQDVRSGRGDVSRRPDDLLGDGGPADGVVPLQDADAEPGPRQVASRDQTVVPAADDHRVVAVALAIDVDARCHPVLLHLIGR